MTHPVTSLLPGGGGFPVRHDPATGRYLPTSGGGDTPRAQQRADRRAATDKAAHTRSLDSLVTAHESRPDPNFALTDAPDIEGETHVTEHGHTFTEPAPAKVHPDLAAALDHHTGWSQDYEDRATGAVEFTSDNGNGGVVLVARAADDGPHSVARAWVHFASKGEGYQEHLGVPNSWGETGTMSILAPTAKDAVAFVEQHLEAGS